MNPDVFVPRAKRFSGNSKQRRVKRRRYQRMVAALNAFTEKTIPIFVDWLFTPDPLLEKLLERGGYGHQS